MKSEIVKVLGLGSIYRRVAHGKMVRVWSCQYSFRGEQKRESTHKTNKRDAIEFLKQRVREIANGTYTGTSSKQLDYDSMKDLIRADYLKNDYEDCLKTRFNHLDRFCQKRRAVEIDTALIDRMVLKLKEEGYAKGTINRDLSCLERMFSLSVEMKLLPRELVPKIQKLKNENRRTIYVEVGTLERILEKLANPDTEAESGFRGVYPVAKSTRLGGERASTWQAVIRVNGKRRYLGAFPTKELAAAAYADADREYRKSERHMIVLFLLFLFRTGWRPAEIAKLRWPHVKFEDRQIHLPSEDTKTELTIRVLPLEGAIERIICMARTLRFEGCDNVFHRNGRRMGRFDKRWKTALKQAGLPPTVWIYDLKRSGVILLRQRGGATEDTAMTFTGHSTREAFARYNTITDFDMRTAIRSVDTYLSSRAATISTGYVTSTAVAGELKDEVSSSGAEGAVAHI
jgi:integrase